MLTFGFTRVRLAAVLAAATMAAAAPAANVSTAPESPGTALSRHIRVLAGSPRDFNALIGAGKAALDLGDVQSAAGFFGRAEEAYPTAPAAKAGLGAAMAHMGDADGAIYYFNQATRLGASALTIALDRGLARDLNGDLGGAQSDYRMAIQTLNSDEGRRRLALSLAIARDRSGALNAIQPLLNRRDPGAQRARAFVLALTGDQGAAAQAIEAAMPGGSARFAPFFALLPHLSVQEKAAAVHLGMFPDDAAAKVAAAQAAERQTQLAARAAPPAVGGPATSTAAAVTRQQPAASQPVRVASANPPPSVPKPSFTLPSQSPSAVPSVGTSPPASASPAQTEVETQLAASDPAQALSEAEASAGNLSGIDKLLATIAEAPPPPQPKVETKKPDLAAAKKASDKKIAADKKAAAEKKAREEKLAAEKKDREEAARLGVKGTYWVQLAGGSNQDRMATEYRKLAAKAGKLLKSRSGYVTEGKDYFRLVIGPFDSKSDSQDFVNKLEKEGVDSFSWTRTPAKIKIEKLKT